MVSYLNWKLRDIYQEKEMSILKNMFTVGEFVVIYKNDCGRDIIKELIKKWR